MKNNLKRDLKINRYKKITETLHNLKSEIVLLNNEEFKKITNYLNFIYSDKETKDILNEDLFYTILSEGLFKDLKFKIPPLHVMRSNKNIYQPFRVALDFLDNWIESVLVPPSYAQTVYFMYYEMISAYLVKSDVIVTLKTVLQNYEKFPSLFDRNFPGYISSGTVPFIFNKSTIDIFPITSNKE